MIGDWTDVELVASARSGDSNAMNTLLERHYDRIYAVCQRIAGGTRDADDATQEALIRIVRYLDRFDGRSAFSTWAYRIATNTSIDELRKRQRRPQLHTTAMLQTDEASAGPVDEDAAQEIEAISDRMAIDEALDQLSEEFRVAVVMRDVADLDYGEIADHLGIPLGTVKSRIARGRQQIVTYFHSNRNHDGDGQRQTERPPTER